MSLLKVSVAAKASGVNDASLTSKIKKNAKHCDIAISPVCAEIISQQDDEGPPLAYTQIVRLECTVYTEVAVESKIKKREVKSVLVECVYAKTLL